MATLVDSSAWIEFFRGTGTPADRGLRSLIRDGGELAVAGPIEMEVLAGAADPSVGERISSAFAACRRIDLEESSDWEGAADIYAHCRRAGVTPRGLVDCLIAAIAIRAGLPLLTGDRGFTEMAEHIPLRLAT